MHTDLKESLMVGQAGSSCEFLSRSVLWPKGAFLHEWPLEWQRYGSRGQGLLQYLGVRYWVSAVG